MPNLPTIEKIKACQKPTPWDFGNNVLYNLCKDYPYHYKSDEIIGKVWLIGRSYSASIERRRNKKMGEGDFYINKIGPLFIEIGLDEMLERFKYTDIINAANIKQVLELHNCLTKKLQEITELGKRSFSSKYLHFHRPELFPMYDSRAVDGIRDFVGRVPVKLYESLDLKNMDEEYVKFVCKFIYLKDQIRLNYDITLTNRQQDNLLLDIADNR